MPAIHDARATMFGLSRHAHGYQRFAGRLAGGMYARITADVAAAGLPAQARVLDAGTGPGLLPLRIATACPQLRLDAIDLSPEMIDRARQNATEAGQEAEVAFAVGDIGRLPFPDDTFDLVVSSISQHHWSDPTAALRELDRVLRPGAQAWIYDFRWALHRAQNAARAGAPTAALTRQSPLVGTPWFNPIGRLVIQP
jgi:ubiquinone/menaquinone biosynthesis C-methylase UbiE